MATSTSLHQRSRSLRVPTSSISKSLQASTSQPLASSLTSVSTHYGPSQLSLFLTNLRLLDLDQRSDWPDITSVTFSTKDSHQDQKRRIQCVEWALYQLFELWDPEETYNKLQPFYPPIDQLQSLNLRAALLRCLDHVKRDGVLGRDTLLRKTMLDECKGERLEEVLSAFSTAVLKKILQESGVDNGAIAPQLAMESLSYTSERTALSALTLIHKASLRKHLTDKRKLHANYKDFEDLLKLKDRQIARRHEQLKVSIEEHRDIDVISDKDLEELQEKVHNNWSGNKEWLETILHGDTRFESAGLLTSSYDNIWTHVESGIIGELEYQQPTGLLEQLEARVREQDQRLEKWRSFSKQLMSDAKNSEMPTQSYDLKDGSHGIDLGFGAHETLQLPLSPVKSESSWQPLDEYVRMMEDLKADLANVGKPKRQVERNLSSSSSQFENETRLVAPLSPVPSEKLNENEVENNDFDSDEGQEGTPHSISIENEAEAPSSQTPSSAKAAREHFSSAATVVETTLTAEDVETDDEKEYSPTEQRSISNHSAMPPPSPPSPSASPLAEQILASMATTSPSPTKPRHVLSLAERTRLSMSRTSTSRSRKSHVREDLDDLDEDDLHPIPQTRIGRSTNAEPQQLRHVPGNVGRKPSQDSAVIPDEPASSQADKYAALMERTRKSMSNHAAVTKSAQVERRRSIKVAAREKRKSYMPRQNAVEEQDEDMVDMSLDLEEKMRLIEGDGEVDYEAVFKSRPRIKTSPERSPVRAWEEMGGHEQRSSSPLEI